MIHSQALFGTLVALLTLSSVLLIVRLGWMVWNSVEKFYDLISFFFFLCFTVVLFICLFVFLCCGVYDPNPHQSKKFLKFFLFFFAFFLFNFQFLLSNVLNNNNNNDGHVGIFSFNIFWLFPEFPWNNSNLTGDFEILFVRNLLNSLEIFKRKIFVFFVCYCIVFKVE